MLCDFQIRLEAAPVYVFGGKLVNERVKPILNVQERVILALRLASVGLAQPVEQRLAVVGAFLRDVGANGRGQLHRVPRHDDGLFGQLESGDQLDVQSLGGLVDDHQVEAVRVLGSLERVEVRAAGECAADDGRLLQRGLDAGFFGLLERLRRIT